MLAATGFSLKSCFRALRTYTNTWSGECVEHLRRWWIPHTTGRGDVSRFDDGASLGTHAEIS